uniref:Legumain prodomain domain-containing protein n=1 Tax=Lactuca sativa TaxID=4236 RepID=A0A9R1V5H7_LACSA|nr:hypothetical protein LSAT_V11C600332910 [Lactuca sativa]
MAHWPKTFPLNLLLLSLLVVHFSQASRLTLFNTLKLGSTVNEPQGNSTTWAVLVAGSNGYQNYRHQANVCHAYQILKRGGLNDENIIVFMYDDIANDPSNPRPGTLINSPNGSDVYAGVPKDYTGESVTAANFYAVLLGNTTGVTGGSGKVVASKPNDRIFVYYTDHGGPGTLVLKTKHASGSYDEMVIYLEACDSGSIMQGLLPDDLNIYVITSTNPSELGWATYCPDMNPPPPPEYDVCLGDLFSVSWMEDSDSQDLNTETLEQQYLKVKTRTLNSNYSDKGSHVMQYGTVSITNETVSVYQGSTPSNFSANPIQSLGSMDVVNQRDADLYSMFQKYKRSTDESEQKELLKKIKEIRTHREHLDSSVDMIQGHLLGNAKGSVRDEGSVLVDDWECLKSMVRIFETHCGSLTQYGMKHTRTFANLCNSGVTKDAMDADSEATCSSYNMGKWNPATVGYSA